MQSGISIIEQPAEMQHQAALLRESGRRIALVPTMGALHDGHLALIRRAAQLADVVVVSIFVNPTQFAPTEDLERYPRPFAQDVERAATSGAAIIFAPAVAGMYPDGFQTAVVVEEVTKVLEGAARPVHFRGVATVVAKFFNIVLPHVAVFGQKDGQQVVVIKRMAADLNFPVQIDVVPTVREPDGLAMSSRNSYLSAKQRHEAPVLFEALSAAGRAIAAGERSAQTVREMITQRITSMSSGSVDYVSVADADSLAERVQLPPGGRAMISLAVRFGTTRLIDNIIVTIQE